MAFQPIFDIAAGRIFAHEALLRTPQNDSAGAVLAQVTADTRYSFDQSARVKAIELAARTGMRDCLSINFMPNAVYNPDHCIQTTLWAAELYSFPIDRIIFEFTEDERIIDKAHLKTIVSSYRARGFRTAIDDFGAGYAGLGLLADVQPDILKLDMALIRDIHRDPVRRALERGLARIADDLGMLVIAEGIETEGELDCILGFGITLVQGFLIARPAFEGIVSAETILAGRQTIQRAAG